MSSKNVLWIGSLLFILLTISCIVLYLDKYNPQIRYVQNPISEKNVITPRLHDTINNTISTDDNEISTFIDQNIKKDIDSFIQITNSLKPDHNITAVKNHLVALQNIVDTNKTKIKPKPIATKIDPKIIPKHPIKPKKHYFIPKQKIVIEPVLSSKLLKTTHNNLQPSHKKYLNTIITQAKQNPRSNITLEAKNLHTDTKKYLKKIKSYLIKRGIKSNHIKIKVNRSKYPIKIVDAKRTNNFIELSLIERI